MDEFFEIVTLIQTKKIPRVPVICIGRDYWNHVLRLCDVLRDEYDAIDPGDEKIFQITDNDQDVIDVIKQASLRKE